MPAALAAAVFYLCACALLVLSLRRDGRPAGGAWLFPAGLAMLCHGAIHALAWRASHGPDMHFFAALSLSALGMAALTSLLAMRGRMSALGVIVFPLAAVFALAYPLYGHGRPMPLDWRLQLHAWCALLAYATLAIAALLALLLWVQERALRQRDVHRWLRVLPPLTELETLLFRTIGAGFVLLTATLLTGMLFVHDLFGQHLAHKTVLSIVSWLVFGVLLFGRRRYGWRGRAAVVATLCAMLLLFLAFFGSQFVYDILLRQR